MMKFSKAEQQDSRDALRQALASATCDGEGRPIIYTVLRSASRSGMQRKISAYVVERGTGRLAGLSWHYDRAHGRMADDSCGRWANKITGCGMDMGFHLAENIAAAAGFADAYKSMRHEWI